MERFKYWWKKNIGTGGEDFVTLTPDTEIDNPDNFLKQELEVPDIIQGENTSEVIQEVAVGTGQNFILGVVGAVLRHIVTYQPKNTSTDPTDTSD